MEDLEIRKEEKSEDKTVASTKKERARRGDKKINRKKLVVIVLAALLLVALLLKLSPLGSFLGGDGNSVVNEEYVKYTVSKRTITNSLTGTGTLQPYDSYTVTATVTGDILSADFEEMDKVEEDQVLYVFDSDDVEKDIEDMKKDVDDAYSDYLDALDDYEDLNVKSDYEGTVRELYVDEGDNISGAGKIAYIVDSETMLLEIPFFAGETDMIANGSDATVTFTSNGEVLSGKVVEISNLSELNSTGSFTRKIKIAVKNPGGITFGMKAYASVIGTNGVTYNCCDAGTFSYNEEETVTCDLSGKVERLAVKEGDRVSKGQIIATLSSESLDKQVKQYKKTWENQLDQLESLEERLEDHTVKAPISGTVVQKNYKALDTVGSSSMSSTTSLAIIYDMSKLTFEMYIDELDLSLVQEGQEVIVTSDSLSGERFTGIISKKSIVGSTSNGTTSYPITIEIDGNDKLLPGMNVDAEILVEVAEDVLAIPVSAVSRGNTVRFVNGDGQVETVNVELGISDEDYIEVKSGLSEGDIIEHKATGDAPIQSFFDGMMNMGGMSGGMSGGMAIPSGGMPSGGMPSGNRGGMSGGGMPGGMRQ